MHKKSEKFLVKFILILSLIANSIIAPQVRAEESTFSFLPAVGVVGVLGIAAGAFWKSISSKDDGEPDYPEGELEIDAVHFDEPGSKEITIKNVSEYYPVMINNIEPGAGLNNIVVGSLDDCKKIVPTGSCKVNITVDKDSYGIGKLVTKYQGGKKTTYSDITISSAVTLELSKEDDEVIPSDKDIILTRDGSGNLPHTQNYKIKNTGKFNWRANGTEKKVGWKRSFDPNPSNPDDNNYYVELDETTSSCVSANPVGPGESCNFSLTYKVSHPGDWGILTFIGANLDNDYSKKVFLVDALSIGINLDPAANHLGYRSVKIANTMPTGESYGDVWIENISLSGGLPGDKLESVCPPNAANCVDGTTCKKFSTRDTSLEPQKNCLVWFKAKEADSLQSEEVDITVTVDGQKKNESGVWEDLVGSEHERTFIVKYDNALYLGVEFNSAGGVPSPGIAKWDGEKFSSLGSGVSGGTVATLASMGGDLYIGGTFNQLSPFASIGKWDGTNFSCLGGNASKCGVDDEVSTLVAKDDTLYLGGVFRKAYNQSGEITTKGIAKWDGENFSALGDGVEFTDGNAGYINSLTFIGDDLYLGGRFDQVLNSGVEKVLANRVAKWDGTQFSSLWDAPHVTDRNYVSVLAPKNDGSSLYIGCEFDGDIISTNNILEYNLSTREVFNLAGGMEVYKYDGVRAFAYIGSDLYLGGMFNKLYNEGQQEVNAYNIAKWDGTEFSPLEGGGVDGVVNALASIDGELYIAGEFSVAGGVSGANNIVRWDPIAKEYYRLSTGVDSIVHALAIAPSITIDKK